MATAVRPLQKVQIGWEVTKGTGVAATKQLQGDWSYTEEQDYYRPAYPAGVLATVGGAGVTTRKGFMAQCETDLTFEEILVPLHTGIRGNVTPSPTGAENTWTFTPQLTLADKTLDAVTLEMAEGDGTTNHYTAESRYSMCSGFNVAWEFNNPVKLGYSLFGRARQADAPTAALAPYTGREVAVSPLTIVSMDDAGGTIGTTPISGAIRSARLEVDTGILADYKLDGRPDLDFSTHVIRGPLTGRLSMTLELNAVGATRVTKWRANTNQLVRIKTTGSTITTNPKSVQFDMACRHTSPPQFSTDGDEVLASFEFELYYDPTWTKTFEAIVVNALTAK